MDLFTLEELSSSNSSSDSDYADFFNNDYILDAYDIDDEKDCYCNVCMPNIPRIQDFIEQVIDNYNDRQFQENFR